MNTEMIKELIAQGKISKAIQAVREQLDSDDPKQNAILLISSEFNSLNRDFGSAILTADDYMLQKRRIIKELIELIS